MTGYSNEAYSKMFKTKPYDYGIRVSDYLFNDVKTTNALTYLWYKDRPEIEKVIFNDPATIVIWSDGTKTVVKCQDDEPFDKEKGFAMAISKKFLGNQGNYYNVFKRFEAVNDSILSDKYTVHNMKQSLNGMAKKLAELSNGGVK